MLLSQIVRRHLRVFAVVLLLGLTCANPVSAVEPGDDPLAGTRPYRRLFLDATVIEESSDLRRVFHPVEKFSANPVIRKEHPWEGWGPYVYGTVLWNHGKLSMWYQGIGRDSADIMYAESLDGIQWTKPNLGLVEYHGSTQNNIVGSNGTCHLPSVIRLPHSLSPDKHWAVFGYGGQAGAAVAYSADGLHWDWKRKLNQEQLFSSADVINVFYDPYQEQFTASFKTTNRRHRAVGIALSKDGLQWHKPIDAAVFGADDLDPDATQIYGMPVFPYQGLYIGLPWIYHARWIKYGKYTNPAVMYEAQEGSPRTVDVQFAWSWDLIGWNRPTDRHPFIPLGPNNAFDSKMIYTARAPVIVGDRLFFYYSGFDAAHDEPHANGAIGLASLRLDGFCSMQAGPKEGWLISRREVFNAPKIVINARCAPGGCVLAELLDRHDRVIPGFSRNECVVFTGDSVRHEFTWNTKFFPPQWIDKDKKIRFLLKNADLYSYLPAEINQQIDNGDRDP